MSDNPGVVPPAEETKRYRVYLEGRLRCALDPAGPWVKHEDHVAALARRNEQLEEVRSAVSRAQALAQKLAVALEGYQAAQAAHARLLVYATDCELVPGALPTSAKVLEAATITLNGAQAAFRKANAPEVQDFSWYGGQVDVSVVREIVKLKCPGSI